MRTKLKDADFKHSLERRQEFRYSTGWVNGKADSDIIGFV